jgi:hypothetical protein
MQHHLPPAIIKKEDRGNYYLALSQADVGIFQPFVEYISERVIHSLEIYLKGARGESIEEPEDIDKEILILKKQLESRKDVYKKYNSLEVQIETLQLSFDPLINRIVEIVKKFKDLFINIYYEYSINFENLDVVQNDNLVTINVDTFFRQIAKEKTTKVNFIDLRIHLNNFKPIEIRFHLTVFIKILFREHDFSISINVWDNDLRNFTEMHYITEWLKSFTYDVQIRDSDIDDAINIFSNGLIDFVKSKTNAQL